MIPGGTRRFPRGKSRPRSIELSSDEAGAGGGSMANLSKVPRPRGPRHLLCKRTARVKSPVISWRGRKAVGGVKRQLVEECFRLGSSLKSVPHAEEMEHFLDFLRLARPSSWPRDVPRGSLWSSASLGASSAKTDDLSRPSARATRTDRQTDRQLCTVATARKNRGIHPL